MITLTVPLILPAPINETLANATLAKATVDLHNHQLELVYVYGNSLAGVFTATEKLPGIHVTISLKTGAIYVNGTLKGWIQTPDLAALNLAIGNFTKGAETVAAGITIFAPNPNGSRSTNTALLALLPGTVG